MPLAYLSGKYDCYSATATMNGCSRGAQILLAGRLHGNILGGGNYMLLLNMTVASCDLSSIQNFEAARKCFENLWIHGCHSFI